MNQKTIKFAKKLLRHIIIEASKRTEEVEKLEEPETRKKKFEKKLPKIVISIQTSSKVGTG
jgi:hypothetical protein